MRIGRLVVSALVVGLLSFVAGRAFTDEDADKEMAEWMKLGAPGDEHKLLSTLAGEWSVEGKHWMGAEPTEFKATSKMSTLFDGRYLREDFSGEFGGMPFQGVAHLGFDNATKEYVGTWIDSMSTAIATMAGTYDASSKSFTWHMTIVGPGGKEHKSRMEMKLLSDKQITSTAYKIGDEGEKKQMEMRYTRK
jgi:hypothetical protein